MWPWGHLAVGYLTYVAVIALCDHGEQRTGTLTAVVIGTQFPDLIDKPLAWSLGLLPSGRSLAHSLLIAVVVLPAVYRLSRRRGHGEAAVAFGVGYVTHSLVDLGPGVVWGLLRGHLHQLQWTTYLVWPVLAAPPYPHDSSFGSHISAFALDPYVLFQFGLFGVAVMVWLASGAPGLSPARQRLLDWLPRRS